MAASSSGTSSGAPHDLGAPGPQRAGGAAGVVGGPLGGAPVLVGGAGPLQAGLGAGLRLGGLVGQFAQLDLPAGPLAQPVGETGEGVGGPAGLLGGLLPFVTRLRGLRGSLVGLGPYGACLGQLGLRLLGERARVLGGAGQLDEPACRAAGAPGGEPGGQFTVLAEPGGERPDLLVALTGPRAQRLTLLVGGVLVVHGRVRRYEEDVAAPRVGRRGRRQQGRRGADRDGGARKECRVTQRLTGTRVRVGVGDDHAVDQFRPGGEHTRVVGGVDGLREIAPAGQRGNAVLAEELDRGQHVGSRRQQSAVAERAEDPGVVGGGGAQLEELAFGGGHRVVQQLPQFVGEAVEFLGRETTGGVGLRIGALASLPGAVRLRARPRHRPGGPGQAQQLREPFLPRQPLCSRRSAS